MSNELLEITINGDLSVADNVEAVCAATMERAKAALKDAGIEIVEVDGVKVAKGVTDSKDHNTLCTNLNKTAKFLSDQRIDFEKRLYEVPSVKRIVEAMKKTADEVLAMREPIWGQVQSDRRCKQAAGRTLQCCCPLQGHHDVRA